MCCIANQFLYERPKETLDKFGRNYLDKMFVQLCIYIYNPTKKHEFKSLSCKKVGDEYMVRLERGDEILEMELLAMVALFEEQYRD